MTRVVADAETGCWMWTGYVAADGYGLIAEGGAGSRMLLVHRVSYELHVGPIPEGLTLDHLCHNRACVNPAHLEPVTMRENIMRGEGLAPQNAAKAHCPSGHPYDEENTYSYRGTRGCRECRREANRRWRAGAAA